MTAAENRGLVVVFGEVLFDRFPDGGVVLGGAPFNVAWNLQAFGAAPLLVSRVGNDELGGRILAEARRWGMDAAGIQIDHERPTGTVRVRLVDDEPHFDIVADCAYDFIDATSLPDPGGDFVLYHGSLASRSGASRASLATLLAGRPSSVFFDVNLRPSWWRKETVDELLATADEVKMNAGELEQLFPGTGELEARASAFVSHYRCDRLHLTRGALGAITCSAGEEPCEVRPGKSERFVDTVGAGDAFSSVMILGRLRGWPLESSLARAQEFAAAVVGLRGATTTDRTFYDRFTEDWNS